MKNLIAYVAQHNAMCRAFPASGRPVDARNLSAADQVMLNDRLEGDLSPENLSQDGELQGIALRRRAKLLNGAKAELLAMQPVRQLMRA